MSFPAPYDRPAPRPAPVAEAERIGSIDVLRGVALLGILVMNVNAFALPWPAYTNPLLGGGTGPASTVTWWAAHLFAEMKFMTIFSALFGAGLVLMAERAEARGARFGATYYRRILWLGLFGLVHAYLLWFGDILYWYAVSGLVLFPLRRLGAAKLLLLGSILVLAAVPLGLAFGFGYLPQAKAEAEAALAAEGAGEELTEEQREAIEAWNELVPGKETIEQELEVYRGAYVEQVVHRAPLVLMFQTVFVLFFGFWRITGVMLLGMAAMRLGVFSARCSTRFYVLCCAIGYGIGLPIVALGGQALYAREFDPLFLNQGGTLPNYFGSLLVAAGHVGAVMLVVQRGWLRSLARRLEAVGRMALTNYLGQTVLCTTLFYGWGCGLFGHLDRFELLGVVVAVWVVQLALSPLWLARYRFGPAEWLWRTLTYGTRPPILRASPEDNPG